jgi:hypothetical protein
MGLNINESNYNGYKKVFEIIWRYESKLFPMEIPKDVDPLEILNGWEKANKSIAKRGLKEGLRDSIFMLRDFSPEIIITINDELQKHNLPNIQKLQSTISDTYKKVLKRAKIKTLDEYYTLKELVIDLTTDIPDEERKLLDQYLTEFEFSKK